ncbi:uncharacterized protein BT62DRAFT_44099 [Guyanagaster necrorhizus]|uniref:Postreplication repair E3 ubiquitin-protein ligase RAD18 n=1 Tax=Guyanagaster necrorhizus TaxID=856835 RepID=A0A9P8AYV7_9AGAR|nr:uncharacterized protein BT62DRAFT_44099 [Guyanagaster necrorhizus MCA 3950]KAG7453048.1 hypothetical protein BT62DRAFT_44099 [Guyanagaster necrorhizus MCA 3950]
MQMSTGSKKRTIEQLAATVSDSTDFPDIDTAPGLRTLDTALRCPICCELFSGPVTLRCGHCFCSLCIRGSLAQKQECPSCRKGEENEGHLRVNPVVEEAVEAWSKARPFILQLLHRGGRLSGSNSSSESGPSNKRKRSNPDSDSDIELVAPPSGHKTGIGSGTVFSKPQEPMLAASPAETPCPVCGKTVKHEIINQHLDSGCKTFHLNNSKTAWSKIMGPRVDPGKNKQTQAKGKERSLSVEGEALPKVSYDTLKDKQIKQLLQDQGLATLGNRALCIARHQKWVMLWNSNLDKAPKNRKSKSQLRSDLDQWLQEKHESKSKVVVEDTFGHQKKYESEFKRLTEEARPKKAVSSQLSDSREATSSEAKYTDATSSTSSPVKLLSQSPQSPHHDGDNNEIEVL